jgi:signal transduction histidine kinase
MRILTLLIALLGSLCLTGRAAQNQDPDSLILTASAFMDHGRLSEADSVFQLAGSLLEKVSSHKIREKYYLNRGLLFVRQWDFERGDSLLEIGLEKASLRQDSIAMVAFLSAQATSLNLRGQLRESLLVQERAKNIAQLTDSANYYGLLANMAVGYSDIGLYDLALDYFLQARDYFSRNGQLGKLAHIENNLGELYREGLENTEQAIEHYKRAIEINTSLEHKLRLAMNYHNMAIVYSTNDQCDSAAYFVDQAIALRESSGMTGQIASSYVVKGDIFNCKKEYDQAIEEYQKALTICLEHNVVIGLYYVNIGEAKSYIGKGKYITAFDRIENALAASREIGAPHLVAEAFLLQSEFYKAQGIWDKAFISLERGYAIRDSLEEVRDYNLLSDLRAKYEADLNQAEAEKEKLEDIAEEAQIDYRFLWNIGLTITLFLVSLVLILIFRAYRTKKRQLEEEKELRRELQDSNAQITAQSEELKKVDSLKNTIFSVLGHDLRAPLSSVASLVQLLGDKAITPQDFEEVSADLGKKAKVSLKSLDTILEWSQLNLGRGEPNIELINVESIVDEIIDLNGDQIKRKNLEIAKKLDSELMLPADRNQFKSIALNLITNAVKFSPEGEKLEVGLRQIDQTIEFFVRDRGNGFPENIIGSLQSESQGRLESMVGTKGEKGNGIGLHIVKDFVRAHGAEIKITNLQTGAEVCVLFQKEPQLEKS